MTQRERERDRRQGEHDVEGAVAAERRPGRVEAPGAQRRQPGGDRQVDLDRDRRADGRQRTEHQGAQPDRRGEARRGAVEPQQVRDADRRHQQRSRRRARAERAWRARSSTSESFLGAQAADDARQRGLARLGGGPGQRAPDASGQVLGLGQARALDERPPFAGALQQPALRETVQDGLHRVAGALVARGSSLRTCWTVPALRRHSAAITCACSSPWMDHHPSTRDFLHPV